MRDALQENMPKEINDKVKVILNFNLNFSTLPLEPLVY